MDIIDIFLEKSKDKFLNNLIKIPKGYDWYLGLVIDSEILDVRQLISKCDNIYEKSDKHLKLLKEFDIDKYELLLFAADLEPYSNNVKGVVKSIAKYIDCKVYDVTYIRYFRQMIFNAWGEQQYFYIIDHDKSEHGVAYDLKSIKEV